MSETKVVLMWDAYFAPHLESNLAFLQTLMLENEKVVILACPTYYKDKHRILSNVVFDQATGQSRFSYRQRIYHSLRQAINRIAWPLHPTINRLIKNSPKVELVLASDLITNNSLSSIRKFANSLDLHCVHESEFRGVKLAPHWSVDLSLDCKVLLSDITTDTPQHAALKSLALHSLLIIEALHSFCQKRCNEQMQFISTSVYSLDWISRQYILDQGGRHVFVQMLSRDSRPFAKIYKSVPEDLFLRRQLQACHAGSNALLLPSIKYAEKYINARLSFSSSHTYSPLRSDASVMANILAGSKDGSPGRPLWVYYTNSPDELVSIAHAYHSSGLSNLIPWTDTGFIRDEAEALVIITEAAHKMKANLVVRQHPRLWHEKRSQFISSTYNTLSALLQEQQLRFPGILTVIEPWEPVNSYELAILSDKIVSFRGTMPLEVSLLGIKPIVLARDKGIMNYWIRDHADAAPRTIKQLEELLQEDSSIVFSLSEICSFLIQFYLLNQYGTVQCASNVNTAKLLASALYNHSSLPSPCVKPGVTDGPSIEEARQAVDEYLHRIYSNLADRFL